MNIHPHVRAVLAAIVVAALLPPMGLAQSPLEQARALTTRAIDLNHMGRTAEAIPLAQRALELRQLSLPADHPEIFQSLIVLADLYQSGGRFVEAEGVLRVV